jgi:hypothetical protein
MRLVIEVVVRLHVTATGAFDFDCNFHSDFVSLVGGVADNLILRLSAPTRGRLVIGLFIYLSGNGFRVGRSLKSR